MPWKRPGFELGVQLAAFVKSRPQLRGVVLANHGLICWGDTSKRATTTPSTS